MSSHPATRATVFGLLVFGIPLPAVAGSGGAPTESPPDTTHVVIGAFPDRSGGGSVAAPRDEMTEAQREAIQKEVDANVERLRAAGNLASTTLAPHPLFGWPMRMAAGLGNPGYHDIQNFVDLDPSSPDGLLDWNCGARTYDGHRGTDFVLWPWQWYKETRGQVEIVAAAAGQITYRADGNFDQNCSMGPYGGNGIYLQHADGSTSVYWHMKNGSVTPKQVGDTVVEGEYLGTVASSGSSTGPHLHFEVSDPASHLIEPWYGPCNNLNPETWWKSQRPYYDSAINVLTTGSLPPTFPGACPEEESPNAQVTFTVGSSITFTAYYRDQLGPQVSLYTIYRPDGSIYSQWTHSNPNSFSQAAYWWWGFTFPVGEMQGLWRFAVAYESNTYERQFTLGSPAGCGSVPETVARGQLLQLEKIATSLRLTWGTSCNASDTDYVIYDGAIGSFTTVGEIRCSTSGNALAIITPAAGSRFYLVGPRNSVREGSLGTTSSGAERPVGSPSCLVRLALECP